MNHSVPGVARLAPPNVRLDRTPFKPRSKADTSPGDIPKELRIATYLFIFSLPWQAVGVERDVFAELSVSKLAGGIFFLMFIFYGKFRINNIKTGQAFFLIYLALSLAHSSFLYYSGIAHDSIYEMSAIYTLAQLILLFLVMSVVFQDRRVVVGGINALILGYVFVVAAHWEDVFAFRSSPDDRLRLLGENSNNLGVSIAVVINAILSQILANNIKNKNTKLLAIGSISILAIALMATGSRGGVLALTIGVLFNAVVYIRRRGALLYSFYFLSIGLILYYIIMGSELMVSRINQSTLEGDSGFRVELISAGLDVFKDQPLFGWGTGYMAILARVSGYHGEIIAAHNTYLQILLEHGLIGITIFTLAVIFTLHSAWQWRKDPLKFTPFILLVSILAGGITKSWEYNKMSWVVFVLANSYIVVKPKINLIPEKYRRKK